MRIGIEHAVVYNILKFIKVNKIGIQTLMQKKKPVPHSVENMGNDSTKAVHS
jgi:hypothetical protein